MWIKATDKNLELWERISELAIVGATKVQDDFNTVSRASYSLENISLTLPLNSCLELRNICPTRAIRRSRRRASSAITGFGYSCWTRTHFEVLIYCEFFLCKSETSVLLTLLPEFSSFGEAEVERPDAVSLQLSCSGDSRDRAFIAQSLNYYPDLDGYYTSRRSLLKIDELRGTQDEVLQMFRILLVAA
jgi:hypothetical protein